MCRIWRWSRCSRFVSQEEITLAALQRIASATKNSISRAKYHKQLLKATIFLLITAQAGFRVLATFLNAKK